MKNRRNGFSNSFPVGRFTDGGNVQVTAAFFMPSPGPCMIPLGAEMVADKTGNRLRHRNFDDLAFSTLNQKVKLFSVDDALKNDTLTSSLLTKTSRHHVRHVWQTVSGKFSAPFRMAMTP